VYEISTVPNVAVAGGAHLAGRPIGVVDFR
jgi:hypothetical protein